jgi:hypothetical protein
VVPVAGLAVAQEEVLVEVVALVAVREAVLAVVRELAVVSVVV